MEDKEKQIKQVTDAIARLDNKDFGLYFFVLDTQGNPTAGIANIYEHVKVLNGLGYKATILHEKNEYFGVQDWLGEEYAKLPHVSIESQELNITGTDFIIVPEIFCGVMDQVKAFPCKKIVFSQSYSYALDLLPIGKRWGDYGFFDVITTSEKQATYLSHLFPNLKTNVIPVGIPSYFKPTKLMKEPIITIVSREQSDALKIVKSFYLQYPTYKWVTFKELRGLPRKNFAEELGKSCLSVWVDDVAGYGTFPLESIECNTPVIGKIPTLVPEWMEEPSENEGEITITNNGVWTNNFLNIPELIATYMKVWLEDSVPEDLFSGMEKTKGNHSEKRQQTKIEEVYGSIIANRKAEFEGMLKSQEEKTQK
jgi:hypothetical protein